MVAPTVVTLSENEVILGRMMRDLDLSLTMVKGGRCRLLVVTGVTSNRPSRPL
jgi:hypothetical protein